MRFSAAAIAVSLVWTACSLAEPGKTMTFELGTEFSLRAAQSAVSADSRWRVGFDGVSSDSRCPRGEQCVWAGDATVRVWVQQGNGPKQARVLHTASGAAQAAQVLGHELRVLRLDPYPISGKPIAAADYQATLSLVQGSSTDAER